MLAQPALLRAPSLIRVSYGAQASLLWHLGLRQADIKRLGCREYMSLFGVSATTLQRRLRFLRDEVRICLPLLMDLPCFDCALGLD